MISRRWFLLIGIAFLVSLAACARAQVIEESFDDGAARWQPLEGEWRVEGGAYVQSDASSHAYRMSLFDAPWREGAIEVSATALERNDNGNVGATFGLVVKYIDEARWCVARFGSYGSCNVLIRSPEKNNRINLGGFSPEIGRSYRVGVIISGGMIAIIREGAVIAIVEDPFPGEAGRPGLFTETHARFDDVRIEMIER